MEGNLQGFTLPQEIAEATPDNLPTEVVVCGVSWAHCMPQEQTPDDRVREVVEESRAVTNELDRRAADMCYAAITAPYSDPAEWLFDERKVGNHTATQPCVLEPSDMGPPPSIMPTIRADLARKDRERRRRCYKALPSREPRPLLEARYFKNDHAGAWLWLRLELAVVSLLAALFFGLTAQLWQWPRWIFPTCFGVTAILMVSLQQSYRRRTQPHGELVLAQAGSPTYR